MSDLFPERLEPIGPLLDSPDQPPQREPGAKSGRRHPPPAENRPAEAGSEAAADATEDPEDTPHQLNTLA